MICPTPEYVQASLTRRWSLPYITVGFAKPPPTAHYERRFKIKSAISTSSDGLPKSSTDFITSP